MENFDDFENKSYVAAERVHYSFVDHLGFLWNLLLLFFQGTAIFCQETLINFVKLFNPDKPKDISGQLALVTGGANGLGKAIALRLAKEQCRLVIADLNFDEAKRTATEIAEKFNVKTVAFKVDVSDFAAIQQLKLDIEESMGFVDILVNNAGILSAISLREGEASSVQKVIDVNLTSHFWTVRTFLSQMIEQKRGHIVAISSLGGKFSFPLACAYCATKFGVKGFMSALYDELCVDGSDEFIKTTCVFPSFINTRKELGDLLDKTKELAPRMTPEYVATKIVEGIKTDALDVTVPASATYFQLINFLPQKTMKFVKQKAAPVGHLKKF